MEDRLDSLAIGVDVGATKVAAALVATSGRVLATRYVKTFPQLGVDAVIEQIVRPVNELIKFAVSDPLLQSKPILGLGIGIPGQINTNDGIVREAVNLGWGEVHLVDEIRGRLLEELPIWIDTDTNASSLGEFYFGAARGCQDFVYISIGSGLGGGIIVNGMLVSGATWKAAELGHLSLDVNGLPCVCGLHGCAETIISGPGLLNLSTRLLSQKRFTSRLSEEEELTTNTVVSAALDGDELALTAFSEVGRHLGIIISICASVLNPALIVIGGGLGLAIFDLIIPAARQEIERRILPSLHSNMKIAPSQLASSAVGAASLVFSQELGGF